VLPIPRAEDAFAGDRLADAELHDNLARIVDELIGAARRASQSDELAAAA